jgi:hypothetical protein
MEPLVPDEELERLEATPPEERIASLEELERRLRAALDNAEPA